MKKKQMEQAYYEAPWCEVVKVENERFFCTSVEPKETGSTEEEWEEEEIDGGVVTQHP